MSNKNFQYLLFKEIKDFFIPLTDRISDIDSLLDFYVDMGYDIRTLIGSNNSQFTTGVQLIATDIQKIDNLSLTELSSITNTIDAFTSIASIPTRVNNLINSFGSNINHVQDLPLRTLEYLFLIHLYKKYPIVYSLLEFTTIIYTQEANNYQALIGGKKIVVKNHIPVIRLDFGRLEKLLSDPKHLFKQEYWPNGIPNEVTAVEVSHKFFSRVSNILTKFDIYSSVGFSSGNNTFSPYLRDNLDRIFEVSKVFNLSQDVVCSFGVIGKILSNVENGPGLLIQPMGTIQASTSIGKWLIAIKATSYSSGIELNNSGVTFYDPSQTNFHFGLTADTISDPENLAVHIGSMTGTRFEIERMGFEAFLDLQPPDKLFGIMMKLNQMKFILKGGDGDGFLSKVLGKGIEASFDLGIGWNNKDQFHFEGAGGFEKYIPTNKRIGNENTYLEFQGIHFGMHIKAGSGQMTKLPIHAGADIKVSFKKSLELKVENVGLKLDISFPPNNSGNFGLFNADFGFKPPNGIGIKIEASKLKGAGYLYFNDGEYIGAISLNLDTGKKKLEINAIGILTTKVPNGKAGYSFLIIASVEGLQIQLGMGFVLDAIGGMLGLHRTMDPEAFREGLKQGKMDSVLFPRDILNNIHRIVSDIQCLYPIKQDQFLIAPMARITWGTPSLIFIDLALVIEIGNPFRLALLGNVYTALPDKDSDIIRLKVAFFGIIDFDKKQIYFDASIYDSKIGFLTIEGDMCVRIFYGEQKEFLMSVGGFHPQFKPAANLNVRSDMRRITVRLLSDNPSLIIQSYIALTSNTLQFGAKADFNFDAGPCNIRAGLALDVLIQFSPFYFIAELHAYAGVYIGGGCLFAIDIYGKLSGPTPWNFVGKAQFDLCFFISVTVRLNITWGDNPPPALPNVSIMPKLLQDLNKLENWTTELPNQKNQYVKLRANTTSKVLIDPMGKLKVSQTTVPLDIKDIKKFGNNQSLDGKAGFKINSVKVGATAVPHLTKAYDSFAASQFFEFNDDDKLRLPSYQNYVSGFIAGSSDIKMGLAVEADTDYEYTIIDTEVAKNTANTQSKFTTNIASKKFLAGNAAGQSIQARDHAQKSMDIGRISLAQTQYIVSSTTAMGRYTGTQNYTTEGEAYQVMNALITANPNLESKLKVLAA